MADDTLDRVARKLQDGAPLSTGSLGAYVRGVASADDFNGETSSAAKAWQGNAGVTKRW